MLAEVEGSKQKRGINFNVEEDKLLISGWLNTSLDAIRGKDDSLTGYWSRVSNFYEQEKELTWPDRSISSLSHRWSNIQLAVSKFCGFLTQIESLHKSGVSHEDNEYVVVLVSNGKSQSEAEADLKPFLGVTTTGFVSWLWDLLSEGFSDSNANGGCSDSENVTDPSSSKAGDVSANICTGKSDDNFRPTSAFENNQDGTLNGCSFKPKQHANSPFKHSQEINVGAKRLFSREAGAIVLQNGIDGNRPGNVWDRLGKLTENDASVKQANECVNMKRQLLEKNSLRFGPNTLIPTVQDGNVNQNLSLLNCNVKSYRNNGGRKRPLDSVITISSTTSGTLDHEKENSRKYTGETENYTSMVKQSDASCKSESSKSYKKCSKSGLDASVSSRPKEPSQEKFGMEALDSTRTLISDGAFPAETGRIRPVQAQLVDMKLRLLKLETEICKLKSKPLKKDGKHALSSSFGSGDPLKEGVELRTVFVTNVDVAATQDALRSYFASCGPISRLIKLTASTITKKWSAYVTFTTKESADKALALHGTNFFSKILRVRKAGKIAEKPTCSQHGGLRNTISQQKHYHDPNVPQQTNYRYDATVDTELST